MPFTPTPFTAYLGQQVIWFVDIWYGPQADPDDIKCPLPAVVTKVMPNNQKANLCVFTDWLNFELGAGVNKPYTLKVETFEPMTKPQRANYIADQRAANPNKVVCWCERNPSIP